LTNATRAEIEQTLEWARGQAGAIISRAQEGAEQLLGAAGLGEEAVGRVAQTIVSAAEAAAQASRGSGPSAGPVSPEPSPEPPEAEPAPEAEHEEPPVSPPASPGPSPPGPQDTGSSGSESEEHS
jgi:hypothetical protein